MDERNSPFRTLRFAGTAKRNVASSCVAEESGGGGEETRKHSREESDSNEDVEQYEAELKKAKFCRGKREREGDKRGRSGTPTRENRGRDRSRKPRNKRAHSNVTDQRREKVNIKHSTQS